MLGGLTQDGADARVGVLNERPSVAIEVDRLLGVEGHVLPRVDLQDEVFQGAEADDADDVVRLLAAEAVELAELVGDVARCGDHLVHQVVRIDDGALAALHLALGQLHHAVGEVDQPATEGEPELVEQQGEDLEVVVLLVADDVDHAVDGVIVVAELGGADVLGHVDRRAIGAQEELLVEAVGGEVGPDGAVGATVEESTREALEHFVAPLEVGLRLVIDLVEADAKPAIRRVEAGVDPAIHRGPKGAHLLVSGLPTAQHLARLGHERRLGFSLLAGQPGGLERAQLLAVMLVEEHVEVAHEVVALLAGRLRRGALAPLLPREHGLADVDAAIVDDVRLDHPVAVGLEDAREAIAKQIVAHVAEVKGLVGVRRRVFDHDEGRLGRDGPCAERVVGMDRAECLHPAAAGDGEVEEAFDHVEVGHGGLVLAEVLADLAGRLFGRLPGYAQEGEDDEGEVALKLLLCLLQRGLFGRHGVVVERLDGSPYGRRELLFDHLYRGNIM